MASLKDLKKRIGSVKNTQQTTRAMKLVSAAKLRRAQDAVQAQRPYAAEIRYLLSRVAKVVEEHQTPQSPLLVRRESSEGAAKRVLMIAMSSDRGLCGSFNTQVLRSVERWAKDHRGRTDVDAKFFTIGRRVSEYVNRNFPEMLWQRSEWGNRVSFSKISEVSRSVVEAVEGGEFHEVWVTFTQFENALTQTLKVERLLPVLGGSELSAADLKTGAEEEDIDLAIIRPDARALLDGLLARFASSQLYRCALESQASEHGARMTAMSNATKNAGDMIEVLTLSYNKQRQANITREISEITGGSEALKA